MGKIEQINDIDYFTKLKESMTLTMVNEEKAKVRHSASWYADRAKRTEKVADNLVEIFNSPSSRNFFLKCAWHLSEFQIDKAIRASKNPNIQSPVKYFVRICNNEMLNK